MNNRVYKRAKETRRFFRAQGIKYMDIETGKEIDL